MRSIVAITVSALVCVCCDLSFADPATDSQDNKQIQSEKQAETTEPVAQDEQVKKNDNAQKDEQAKKDDNAQKDEQAKKDDNAQKDEQVKKDDNAQKDEQVKKDDNAQKADPSKPSAPAMDPQIALAFQEFNNFRARYGLRPCRFDPNLQRIAQYHSNNMYYRQMLYHSGTPYVAENVYMGSYSGVHAVRVWMGSPGHSANMLGPYTRVGIARAGQFFTMILQ